MGFKFSFLCDLLSSLENNRTVKASTAARTSNPDIRAVVRWFAQHEKRIHHETTDRLALLSSMFPEKRTDRVYFLQECTLNRVIGRCLLLGSSRREELERWRVSGGGDLGQCVENVMRQAENQIDVGQEVTVEEIDEALNRIASRCRFSGPKVRRQHTAVDVEEALAPLYRRLSSRDAKWLTRMILKSYAPVVLPAKFVIKKFHFLLPHLLLFQDSFEAALSMLATHPLSRFPPHPDPGFAEDLSALALLNLTPKIGIKIGRPEYWKARSIKHCCDMVGRRPMARRRMSLERKYDGEYCQIHIDLAKSYNSIQIFSKSGKDSTLDRCGIHQAIKESLRIGKPDCTFSQRCILEGELLVWSDKHERILEFNKLRKFISRSGTFIGVDNDSPPQHDEHLMIVYFDILLLDDNVCLTKPHRERRLLLKDTVKAIPGHAGIAEQEIIDFSHRNSRDRLEKAFTKSIVERWEGYVLKGCDDPYFFIPSVDDKGYLGPWIKLKKDYIPGLGDTADLVLIGGRYDSRDAQLLQRIHKLSWTHFYIGCLLNKEDVIQLRAKPKFRVVDVINHHCMHWGIMQHLNQFGEFSACKVDSNDVFDIEYGRTDFATMEVIFKTPFVVEMLGSGFEKPSNARYFTLRFPRIQKIHCDRTFEEAASFSELQLLAETARSVPSEELSQEEERWRKRLKLTNGFSHYIVDRSQSVSTPTSSPPRSDCGSTESTPRASSTTDISSGSDAPGCAPLEDGMMDRRDLRTNNDARDSHSDNPIGIYIDKTVGSPTVPENSDIEGNFLAENNNLASNQSSQEKDAGSSSRTTSRQKRTTESENRHHHDNPNLLEARSYPPIQKDSTQRSIPDETRVAFLEKEAPTMSSIQKIRPRSPLRTVPIYVHQPLPPGACRHIGSSCTVNDTDLHPRLDQFLQDLCAEGCRDRLRKSNPQAFSLNMTYGLVLLDRRTSSINGGLPAVVRQLWAALTSRKPDISRSGKIFLVDSGILTLGTGTDDPRFCLRQSWENIGKEHFYACLTWTIGSGRSDTAKVSTAATCIPDPASSNHKIQRTPQIAISFDRHDLEALGEFVSVEPLVHFTGQKYELG